MTKLKLGAILDDKPVKLTVEFSAPLYRDLQAYAQALADTTAQPAVEPTKLVPLMVERFMNTDRGFTGAKKARAKP